MINISELLNKFKSASVKNLVIKSNIIEVVFKYTKIELKPNQIVVQNNIATVKTSPLLKSEILLNKKNILAELNLNQSKAQALLDIR